MNETEQELDDCQRDCEEMERELERLRQREESAREFVKRHPALSIIDLAEFEAYLKLPEIMNENERSEKIKP